MTIDRAECEPAQALLTLRARLRYGGPIGLVEAPVIRLADAQGRTLPPRSLVWQGGGGRALAQWLAAGGVTMVQAEDVGTFELRFDVRDAAGELRLEFGDISAFALTAKAATSPCRGVLKPEAMRVPRAWRIAEAPDAGARIRVFRAAYPCRPREGGLRTVEADHPPYVARQVLLLGRGYLPSAREIDLPQGKAPAQPYAYAGRDSLDAVEQAARRAIARDLSERMPALVAQGAARGTLFAFNWGTQKAPSGNEMHAVALYDVRPCGG